MAWPGHLEMAAWILEFDIPNLGASVLGRTNVSGFLDTSYPNYIC